MKVVFASLPADGHLYPLPPLALACADAERETARRLAGDIAATPSPAEVASAL